MPRYKAQLKQGSRTLSKDYEAKDLENLLTFLEATTTMQVKQVSKIIYDVEYDERPDEPSKYFNNFRGQILNSDTQHKHQIMIPHFKKDALPNIFELVKKHLEIKGNPITDLLSSLF